MGVVNDSDRSIKVFSQTTCTFNTRVLWTNNNDIRTKKAFVTVVFGKERNCIEVIYWNVKETLNLNSVEVKALEHG